MNDPLRALFAAGIALFSAQSLVQAQSATWSPGFAAPALPSSATYPIIAAFDDGGGSKLYSRSRSLTAVIRWTGTVWETVFEPGIPGFIVWELFPATQAGVPVLLLVYGRLYDSHIWRFDGSSWTQLGSLPYAATHVGVYDDGSGEALFACGHTWPALTRHVSRWDGSTWSQVGSGFQKELASMVSFDDGSGPQLYVGGTAPAIVGGSTVARWDGVSWNPVGNCAVTVRELAVLNGQLFLAAELPGASGGLQRWNGSAWEFVGAANSYVYDFEPLDLGSGPELIVAGDTAASWGPLGRLTTPGGLPSVSAVPGVGGTCHITAALDQGSSQVLAVAGSFQSAGGVVTDRFAFWDGTNWSALGRGFNLPVQALAVHDHGTGPELHAVGPMRLSGHGVEFESTQRWNGTDWSKLGTNIYDFRGINAFVMESLDLGSGAQLYAGGVWVLGDPYRGVARWNGTSWAAFAPLLGGDVHALTTLDSGSGPQLIAAGNFLQSTAGAGNSISRFDGTSWIPLGSGMDGVVKRVLTYDDGSGMALYAGGQFSTAGGVTTGGVARWNGSAWSALGSGITGGVEALRVFDDGSGEQLYAGGTFTNAGGVPVQFLARWNGTSWSDVPGGGSNGAILALHVHDDGRGDALYVGGGFGTIGGITAYNIARFDGSTWEAVDGGFDNVVRAFASVDDDGDGDLELFAGGDFLQAGNVSSGRIARLEGRPHYTSFCFGDGTLADHTTPCPCGNDGAPGHGCANAFDPNGALLQASGNVNPDTLVLAGSGMPLTAFGIYLQHNAADDRVFHDGVICAGGNLIRLRNRNAVGGSSTYPNSTDTQTVSQRGQVTPGAGATRYYSLFYRAASPTFCPPATANVTNGIRVVW